MGVKLSNSYIVQNQSKHHHFVKLTTHRRYIFKKKLSLLDFTETFFNQLVLAYL